MNSIGAALVWCILQVTLLAGLAALLYGLARRSGPPVRGLAAFAGLILISGLTLLAFSPWPRWRSGPSDLAARRHDRSPEASHLARVQDDAKELLSGDAAASPPSSKRVEGSPSPTAVFFETLLEEMQHPPTSAENGTWRWPAYVAALLLASAGVGLVRLVAGLAAVRSYRLRARPISDSALLEAADVLLAELRGPKSVELCESELLTTPATIGWRRPLIILPADWRSWSSDECRAVLAHEIAHIARHDFPTWVAAQAALVFHFYHPLVHWLAARLRLEQELAADAAAAQLVGGQQPYLATLAAMALRQSERPLAWPARTFLPTRGTFMRRIEMLRDDKLLLKKMTAGMRVGVIATLAAASLGVAGLRGTAADRADKREAAALAQAPADKKAERLNGPGLATSSEKGGLGAAAPGAEPFSLAWVPRDAIAVAGLRPAALFTRPALAALRKAVLEQSALKDVLGISPDRIDQAIVVVLSEQDPTGQRPDNPVPAGVIVRVNEAGDASALMNSIVPNPQKQEYSGQEYFRGGDARGQFCFLADERTVVFCSREEHVRRLIVAGKTGASKTKWADSWKAGAGTDVVALLNTNAIRNMLNQAATIGQPALIGLAAFSPLWESTTTAALSAEFGEKLSVTLTLRAARPDDAQTVRNTLAAALTLGQNSLSHARGQISRLPGREGAPLLRAVDIVDSLLDSVKVDVKDDQVRATTSVEADEAAALAAMLVPAISNAREAARQAQATNNLKQIALAMHNYADVNGSFPPAVLYGPDGKTPYSWRVALLPFLEQVQLFQQYNFNQPWDSPANKQVLANMPPQFRDPNDAAGSTFSSYYGLTGPSTIFSGKEGSKFLQITDGTSNTLMFVEAKRDIPWTKPEDIPYDKDKPFPKLGGHYPDGFIAALCDGSVRFLRQNVDETLLRSIITRDGGEVVDMSKLDNPPELRRVVPPGGATPRQPTPPRVEK
jgi:beta-lactamase regulating signal transducer with metallopeptidase domain/type II secretory pathway pseudopilin PulG